MKKKTFISSKYRYMLLGGTISAVLFSLLYMTDMLIAGILLGEEAVAAVNLVLPFYSLTNFFSMVISLGVPILYSGQVGAFRRDEADRTFGTGLVLSLVTGAALMIGLALFGDAWLAYYRPDAAVLRSAREYLGWMKYVALVMPVEELLFGMVYADGDEAVSTAGNLLSSASNVVLSVILCRRMGTRGLALATFASLLLSLGVLLLHFLRKGNTLRLCLAFSHKKVADIVRFSIVDSCAYLFLFVFTAVMNRFAVRMFGAGMLIMVSVIALVKETQLVFDGVGEAITPILSVYLGEENYPGVREVWGLARRTANIESLVVTGLLFAFAPQVIGLLHIQEPEIFKLACHGLRILSVSLIFTCRLYLDSSYDILADKISLGVLVSALRDVLLPLPLAMLGGLAFGIPGMFAGVMLSQPLAYLLSCLVVRIRYGKENYPLFLAEKEKPGKMKLYEFSVTPELVAAVRDQLAEMLRQNGCSGRTVNRAALLFEELFMDIRDHNGGKTVLAECAVEMGEHVRMIVKDDGILFDQTDVDREVDSLRGYVISGMITSFARNRIHFRTLSFNRSVYMIE